MQIENPYDLSGWRVHALCSALEECESPDEVDPDLAMFPETYNTEQDDERRYTQLDES